MIDPVVVGITCTAGDPGHVLHADVCGETLGDVLFEVPDRHVVGQLSVLEAARDLAEVLADRADLVVAALGDPARRPN